MRLWAHLVASDWRRGWPILTLAVAVHAGRSVIAETWPSWLTSLSQRTGGPSLFDGPAAAIELLACYLAVSLLVHRDPLVGLRAFWLTRPIPPRTLLAAKVSLAFLVLVAVPALIGAGRLMACGAPMGSVAAGAMQLAISRSLWVVAFWLVAAVTPTTVSYLLATVGVIVSAMLAATVTAIVINLTRVGRPTLLAVGPSWSTRDDSPFYVAALVLLVGSLAVLAWQYGARRRLAAAALGVAVCAGAAVASTTNRTTFAAAREPAAPAWLEAVASKGVTLVDHQLRPSGQHVRPPDGVLWQQLDGTFDLEGLWQGFSTRITPLRTQLTLEHGQPIESSRGYSVGYESIDGVAAYAAASGVASAFGAFSTLRPLPSPRHARAYLVTAPAHVLRPHIGHRERISAELEVRAIRHTVAATLPIERGAAIRTPYGLVQVQDVGWFGRDARVLVRVAIFPTFRPRLAPDLVFGVHEPDRREWSYVPAWSRAMVMAPSGFALGLRGYPHLAGRPWGSEWMVDHELSFTPPELANRTQWLGSLRLMLVEAHEAGRVTTPWSDPAVTIAPAQRTP